MLLPGDLGMRVDAMAQGEQPLPVTGDDVGDGRLRGLGIGVGR